MSYSQNDSYTITHFSTNKGLSSNNVTSIIQDDEGFIWFGTENGLDKYDGYSVESYNSKNSAIPENQIKKIIIENQNLWVFQKSHLSLFNKTNQHFTNYSLPKNVEITCGFLHKNTIWIGTKKGIYVFNKPQQNISRKWSDSSSKLVEFINNTHIRAINTDSKNRIWISTYKGLFLLNNFHNTIVKIKIGEKVSQIASMHKDKQNALWFSTNSGLFKLLNTKGDNLDFMPYNSEYNESIYNHMFNIVSDKNNDIWAGYSTGLYKVNQKEQILEDITNIRGFDSLNDEFIYPQLIDNNNNLWISTPSGVYKLSENELSIHLYRSNAEQRRIRKLQNNIWSIYKDKYKTWLGTAYGLMSYNPKNENFNSVDLKGLNISPILNITELNKDELLINSYNNVVRFNKNTLDYKELKNLYNLAPNDLLYGSTHKQNDSIVWVGSSKGLFRYNIVTHKAKYYNLNHLKLDHHFAVNEFFEDSNNNLWVAGFGKILLYDSKNDRFNLAIDSPDIFSILCFTETNDGSIWVGTYENGLYKIIQSNNTLDLKPYYTINQPIPKIIYTLNTDTNNRIWGSSNQGVFYIDLDKKQINTYDVHDGCQSNDFTQRSFFEDSKGLYYFGGVNGYNVINPNFKKKDLKSKLKLSKIQIEGEKVTSKGDTLIVQCHQKNVSFEFTDLLFDIGNSKTKYYVKLENFDQEWSENGYHNKIIYHNIPHGDYTFKVKAISPDMEEQILKLNMIVQSPFWKKSWFYPVVLILTIILGYYIYKSKTKQLKLVSDKNLYEQLHEEKETMLKEIHHRVKNNLQVVNSLLRTQSRNIEDYNVKIIFKKAEDRIRSMSLLHEKMYQSNNLKDININDHFSKLINELISSYAIQHSISKEIDIDSSIKLTMDCITPLGLIINEIISNSFKHAFKNNINGKILISLKETSDNNYRLLIGDNGIGFSDDDFKNTKNSTGIKLTKLFVKQINGSIKILDKPGTIFEIIFSDIKS